MDGPAWAEARMELAEKVAIELGISFAEAVRTLTVFSGIAVAMLTAVFLLLKMPSFRRKMERPCAPLL